MRPLRSRTAAGAGILVFCLAAWTAGAADRSADHDIPRPSANDFRIHNAGTFACVVTNWGQVGARPGSNSVTAGEPSFEWLSGSGVEYLWVGGVWIGATVQGDPHVTTTQYAVEVRPGSSSLDRLYATFEGTLGGSRAPSPEADDDGDGMTDEDVLNGRDDDADGSIDEDFAAISDQMFIGAYSDTAAVIRTANPDHRALGALVEQSSFAWTDPRIDDLLALRYRITNGSAQAWDDVHLGLFADPDIGGRHLEEIASDDRAGFWEGDVEAEIGGPVETVRVSVVYAFDADGDNGTSLGRIGLVYLGARDAAGQPLPDVSLKNARAYSGNVGYAFGGEPTNDNERLETLDGTAPQSLGPPDPQTGLHPPFEVTRNHDYRILTSAGPVADVAPGATVEVAFAIVIGEGHDGLIQNAARALLLYRNDWRVAGPVAITVQDLEARAIEDGVQLSWRLAGSGGLQAVYVERATTAAGPWSALATLAPAVEMTVTDRDPAGPTSWYRLVLEASDGTRVAQPAIAPVEVAGASGTGNLRIEPPVIQAEGAVVVRWTVGRAGPMSLNLFDVRGRRVASLAAGPVAAGSHLRLWDGRDDAGARLGRGVYWLRLESSGATAVQRFVALGH